ncbi:hypothetical protein [Zongyangia hominis]|uniref:Uncharacterized protein n=1 Tax=Zongyangia hominis TaxID=2763677 RepID=A0A926EDZ7_9FIRM|nr:hypothetical protein [Zongyangia hominis]MBC8571360.1 hypothetical protein [Zongyangia hominis]
MELIFSTVLFFCGLAVAAAVLGLALYHIVKRRRRLFCALYALCAAGYGVLAAANLIHQSSGIACAMTPATQLIIFGGLLLLHLVFLWDCVRLLPESGK